MTGFRNHNVVKIFRQKHSSSCTVTKLAHLFQQPSHLSSLLTVAGPTVKFHIFIKLMTGPNKWWLIVTMPSSDQTAIETPSSSIVFIAACLPGPLLCFNLQHQAVSCTILDLLRHLMSQITQYGGERTLDATPREITCRYKYIWG